MIEVQRVSQEVPFFPEKVPRDKNESVDSGDARRICLAYSSAPTIERLKR